MTSAAVRTRARGLRGHLGIISPAGSLDRWRAYATPAATAAARKEVLVIGDSTSWGAGGNYAWCQRLRDRCAGAGLTVAGKGIFAGGEVNLIYDSPEVNGFVAAGSTFSGVADAYDNLTGEYYRDTTAGHILNLQFKGTCARLWYGFRGSAAEFTYSVDGGTPVLVDALNPTTNTVKFIYISGLTAGLHTIQIVNRGGRTANPPASAAPSANSPASGTLTAGTYYYVATYMFGGGETLPSPVGSIVIDGAGRSTTTTIPKVGQDDTKLYRSTSSSGPFQLVTTTVAFSSGTQVGLTDSGAAANAAINPPTTGTTNLNTSQTGCTIALAPMYDTGVAIQKYAHSGGTMATFMNDPQISMYWLNFGLAHPTGAFDDPASYSVDTSIPSAGRVKPVLAILDLMFNDLSADPTHAVAIAVQGVKNFSAACRAASCDGIVISGQLPYNAQWATYGKPVFEALRDTALNLGLTFVDHLAAIEGVSGLAYAGSSTNPHLDRTQYETQADFLFDQLLADQIPAILPANTVAPLITGATVTGASLTCSTGTWTSFPSAAYTYQWKRAGTPISGATASTYTLVTADLAVAVTCTVTATNAAGFASATSSNSVTSTAPFDPSTLNPAIWLKADALTGLADGDPVSAWADSSANARNFASATTGQQPLYKTGIVGGKPVLRFDGTDDRMTSSSAIFNTIFGSHAYTVVVVAKSSAINNGQYQQLVGGGSTVNDGNVQIGYTSGSNIAQIGQRADDATFTLARDTAFHVLSAVKPAAAGSSFYVGGVALTQTTTNKPTNVPASGGGSVSVGWNSAGSSFFPGDIAEVLIFTSDLNSTDRGNLESYLSAKYGI